MRQEKKRNKLWEGGGNVLARGDKVRLSLKRMQRGEDVRAHFKRGDRWKTKRSVSRSKALGQINQGNDTLDKGGRGSCLRGKKGFEPPGKFQKSFGRWGIFGKREKEGVG